MRESQRIKTHTCLMQEGMGKDLQLIMPQVTGHPVYELLQISKKLLQICVLNSASLHDLYGPEKVGSWNITLWFLPFHIYVPSVFTLCIPVNAFTASLDFYVFILCNHFVKNITCRNVL